MKAYFFNAKDKMGITYESKDIPEAFIEKASKYREILIENLSDFDDEIAKYYIEGLDIDPNLIFNAIREATISLKLCPVLPGSALKNKGIQFLMDAVIDFLPSPTDLPPIPAIDLQGKDELIEPKEDNKLCGLAFKLMNDEYVGKLVFFRIYSGTLKKGTSLLNPRTNKTERISRILRMKANDREDIDIAYAGDICALVGLREVFTGDTLCDKSQVVVLEPPVFPETVISMSIEPKTSSDKDKLELGLKKLTEEDPTFFVKVNEDTSQTIISGMGELHLEIIRDRLLREFQVKAEAGKPQIAYRETINNSAQAEGKFDRKIGEINHFAEISIKLKPLERGQGINIDCSIESNLIPKEFLDICVGGIKEASKNGSLAGYQLTDFYVDIYDGIYREVDSSEMAFKMAGIFALRNALEVANPILLEPIMEVQVETPEEYQGDIIGDLNRKRGQIRSIDTNNNYLLISSLVPLAEMFGYSTIVRSLSKGRASYTMKPKLFEEVPQNILKSILNPNHLTN